MTDGAQESAVGVQELAALLGVSTDTVYGLARSGEIPAFRVGRLWRFWPSTVRNALDRVSAERDPWAMNSHMHGAHRGWANRRARAASDEQATRASKRT